MRFQLIDHMARVVREVDADWNTIRDKAQECADETDCMIYYHEAGYLVNHKPVIPAAWEAESIFHRPQAG